MEAKRCTSTCLYLLIINLNFINISVAPEPLTLDNIKPMDNQVAGHVHYRNKSKKYLAIMKYENGTLLKPISNSRNGQHEIDFYETIRATEDPELKELREYIPQYLGVKNINIEGKDVKFVHMEDLTREFKYPCIVDVKIGTKTWVPNTKVTKILDKKTKYGWWMNSWGFRVTGCQYYKRINDSIKKLNCNVNFFSKPQKSSEMFRNFLNGDAAKTYGLLDQILEKLQKIRFWFLRQKQYLFFSTSILIMYEAEDIVDVKNNVSSSAVQVVDEKKRLKLELYMIDFCHVIKNTEDKLDQNYITGLEKLIQVFQNLNNE